MLNIILFGPPGAGKGTQSERIVEKFDLIHISTGDVFRYNIKNETELGKLAKSYMDQGKLVPDEVTIKMLKAEVEKTPDAKGFIFDGFPRTENQAIALDQFLKGMDEQVDVLLSLEVDEEELRERLKNRALTSGRTDDADPEVIQNRIDVYKNETAPVKSHYEKKNKLMKVDGVGSIDTISDRLFSAIDSM